jgi:hypothetical protein
MSGHPWYLHQLGKPTQAQTMAVFDVLRSGDIASHEAFLREFHRLIVAEKYDAFVLEGNESHILKQPNFLEHYTLANSDLCKKAFRPVTGEGLAPKYIYVRRPDK